MIFDEFGLFSQVSSHKGKYSHFCWFWWIWSIITCKVLSLRMFYLDLLIFFVLPKTWNNPFLVLADPIHVVTPCFFKFKMHKCPKIAHFSKPRTDRILVNFDDFLKFKSEKLKNYCQNWAQTPLVISNQLRATQKYDLWHITPPRRRNIQISTKYALF